MNLDPLLIEWRAEVRRERRWNRSCAQIAYGSKLALELEAFVRRRELEELTPTQAAAESGFSIDTISRRAHSSAPLTVVRSSATARSPSVLAHYVTPEP